MNAGIHYIQVLEKNGVSANPILRFTLRIFMVTQKTMEYLEVPNSAAYFGTFFVTICYHLLPFCKNAAKPEIIVHGFATFTVSRICPKNPELKSSKRG
jgi:hypothetical protein